MRSCAASAALALAASAVTASLTRIGNITLFSDTTCSDPIFLNSWNLGRDFCAKLDKIASSPVDVPFQSYILNERPWCDNGSRPDLNLYRDEACAGLIRSFEPGALYKSEDPDADGTCVAPGGEYRAMAFVCDGFEGAWGGSRCCYSGREYRGRNYRYVERGGPRLHCGEHSVWLCWGRDGFCLTHTERIVGVPGVTNGFYHVSCNQRDGYNPKRNDLCAEFSLHWCRIGSGNLCPSRRVRNDPSRRFAGVTNSVTWSGAVATLASFGTQFIAHKNGVFVFALRVPP
ncbi:hypothetical protein P171DRAFT_277296 [Karstenula rhodostoma CBS 690.94]|uniref:Cyanovirin-N domain-containing protein n=1 Tax=Karstenula rhodostoma CBS 690.94 TaxID=1392251 RepID=A0A9P4PMF4_9PLEO|nr:hypothetical protein P171DRAFT_277296 [Karstenula rhodostoma CBS 690.94]